MYGGMNLLFNVQSTLVQRCKHVTVVSTLWRRCETDAAIPMVQRRCQCKIHGISWAELNMQCWGNVRATLYIWGCSIKVVQTLWNWCLDSTVRAMLSIQYASYIVSWGNTPMLQQHLLIVAIWTLWYQRRYNIIYWLCDVTILPQYCLTIVFLRERYLLFNTLKSFDSQ